MLAHFAPAAGNEARLGVAVAFESAARDLELLEDGDVSSGQLTVADEEGGGGQGSDPRADDVGLALGSIVGGTGRLWV